MKWRWRLVVHPKFQTWFLSRFMIYLGSLVLLLGTSIYLWFKIVDETMFRLVGLISPSAFTLIQMNSDKAMKVFLGLAGLWIGLSIVASFIFSISIAGPLFAFARHLKKCEKNHRLEEFSLRKGDHFFELAETFNRMVRAVKVEESSKLTRLPKLQSLGNERSHSTAKNAPVIHIRSERRKRARV